MFSSKILKKVPAPPVPNAIAIHRIHQDITCAKTEILEGIHVHPDEQNIMVFHAIIEGPADTPYACGFFYFYIKMPNDYPWSPPKVKLMTTGGGSVGFNPNLYNCGKVCLSILGTWEGPPWTPAMNIVSVLLSIQSLMNKEPYFNEPGFERSKGQPVWEKASKEYSDNIQYETLRVAIIGMVNNTFGDSTTLPAELKQKIRYMFVYHYDEFVAVIKKYVKPADKKYADLLKEFQKLKKEIDAENK